MMCDALKNYDQNLCEAVFMVDETVSHEIPQITIDFKVHIIFPYFKRNIIHNRIYYTFHCIEKN